MSDKKTEDKVEAKLGTVKAAVTPTPVVKSQCPHCGGVFPQNVYKPE
jgi:hypothetical protein